MIIIDHTTYILVLAAHNGFRFDFPILLSEIQRRPKSLNFYNLSQLRLHFADTLGHLRQVWSDKILISNKLLLTPLSIQAKKDQCGDLKQVTKFGLEDLYKHFFPEQTYPGNLYNSFIVF